MSIIPKALAFIRRDFQTQISYRLNFISRIIRILISIATFYFISQTLNTVVNPYLEQYNTDYFHFALLGIAFYPFIGLSTDSMSDVIRQYQQNGTLEILFLTPTPFLSILIMSTLWLYCWTLLEALFYLFSASLLFGANLAWSNILVAALVIILTILANAGLALFNAGFVLVTKQISPLIRFLAVVTNLLAGTYYPVDVLPSWLQTFSLFLPATHAFRALRGAMLQGASLADISSELMALGIFIIVTIPLGLRSFAYAVRWAKIDGSLSQY